jgi:DNA-directed RNA polymerase subunit RPC12/RpoP
MDKYNKRYTLNEVKEIFISNGYTPIFNTYKTNKEKLLCQSIKDGYKGFIRLNSLLNGQKIAWFHQSNPYTIDNIKKFIINNKLDCELISQEWISSYNDLEFKCLICDKIFNMPWNTFSEGNTKFCQECTNRRLGSDKRHDFDFIFNEFVKKGYYPMFNSYVDNKEKLLVKDKEGYFGLISYHQLSSNHGFDKFHPKNPYTYKNIENYIKNNNLECKFITGIYKNNESKLTFRCGCGEYFTTSWAIFSNLNKTRCDSCSKVKSKLEFKTS